MGAAAGVTAGTACGQSPGPPGAAARRAVGLPPEGRDESCRPAYGAPRPDPGRRRRATLAFISPAMSRARLLLLHVHAAGPARRRCALEAVEKVVTTENGQERAERERAENGLVCPTPTDG
jgi:hypothetical protein